MRYRETTQQADSIASVSTDMMLGTAIYTLLLGIGFVAFGVRVRKRWITFWGATMVLAGSAYTIAVTAGLG
jgi:hypothetical protein